MSKSSQLACNLLMVGILLLITRSTQAASLIVPSGQTVQLGVPGVTTNYSYGSVTVETGGTLQIAGNVTLIVTTNVLINGEMVGDSTSQALAGMDGADGDDGVNEGGIGGPGDDGDSAANGTNSVGGAPYVIIYAKNMTVNGSILFNPQDNASDGGDGGGGGTGADGSSPLPSYLIGGRGGDGGVAGVGGYGGNVLSASYLSIDVAAGNFILGTNGMISLDNMGNAGGGGNGGDGGMGGTGGNGISGGGGGAGGDGGPAGFGGAGGVGGDGGTLVIRALGIDLEGQISLKGNDGGDGGDFGTPMDGGNGGNGSAAPGADGNGGNGGDAGDAYLDENPGGGGGNGGDGGNFYIYVSGAFTNFAKIDFSGGMGGQGGAGQAADTATGGDGGDGAGGAPSGYNGQSSEDIPDGPPGFPGGDGSMSVVNPYWGTNAPNGWQTFGSGILTFGLTNNIHTLIMSSTNGPFSIVGPLSDPRYQYDSGAGEYLTETNEPVELQFAYQWLSTSGSVDVLLGGQVVLRLNAPATLTNNFTEASLILTGLPAEESGDLNLTFQLNTAGSDQFQLGNLSLQALPQLPSVSIGPSSADSTALSLNWFGATNENYQVQYRTSLGSGTWINLGSAIPGQGAASSLVLTVTPGDPAMFYRLVMTPVN